LVIYLVRRWHRMAPETSTSPETKGMRGDLDTCCAPVSSILLQTERREADSVFRAGDTGPEARLEPSARRVPEAAIDLTAVAEQSHGPDDLTRIEGIGPKINDLLHANGILTFAQLATTEAARLRAILSSGGTRFRIADPTTWPEQALFARDGKWDELKAFQDSLKAGRAA
jgi:predicted flap endonuclease-1-like 5' DNA nuclease